jgi:hypothetical protein
MKEKRVVFKRYVQDQPMLLPPSYEELVPENHPVRVVNEVVERIDIGAFELQGWWDVELSSEDAAQSGCIRILEEHLFIAEDGAGT